MTKKILNGPAIFSYPNLLHRPHGLLLDQFKVESRGQDEDEHGSSGGP